jgi:hypothetical protein
LTQTLPSEKTRLGQQTSAHKALNRNTVSIQRYKILYFFKATETAAAFTTAERASFDLLLPLQMTQKRKQSILFKAVIADYFALLILGHSADTLTLFGSYGSASVQHDVFRRRNPI